VLHVAPLRSFPALRSGCFFGFPPFSNSFKIWYDEEAYNHSFENLLEMKTCFGNTVIFLWVMAITFFPLACGKGCSEEQNRALLEIRNSTNGLAFADWDGRNCCEAFRVRCYSRNGGVSSITLDNFTSSTWYPNVTWFTLFEELEELYLYDMQIGGGLQRENSYLI
jgi:hypothetical protein